MKNGKSRTSITKQTNLMITKTHHFSLRKGKAMQRPSWILLIHFL